MAEQLFLFQDETPDSERQKYFRHLEELRQNQKLREHLDNFDFSPAAMQRKKRRLKRQKKWQAFCDAITPVDGFIRIPLHEAMRRFPDCYYFKYGRYHQEQEKLRDQKMMEKLQEHKRKLGVL